MNQFKPPKHKGLVGTPDLWVQAIVCKDCLSIVYLPQNLRLLNDKWFWEQSTPNICQHCGYRLFTKKKGNKKSFSVKVVSARYHEGQIWYRPWTWMNHPVPWWEIRQEDLIKIMTATG